LYEYEHAITREFVSTKRTDFINNSTCKAIFNQNHAFHLINKIYSINYDQIAFIVTLFDTISNQYFRYTILDFNTQH